MTERTAEQEAMEILMMFTKDECNIMDSGGKDSTALKYIANKCKEKYGLQYHITHNHTTLDAPETVYFIRSERERYAKAGINYNISYPETTFEKLCMKRMMLPTRLARFCCQVLKERESNSREKIVTGVRRDESVARKKNQGAVLIRDDKGEHADGDIGIATPKGGTIIMNYDNDKAREIVETCFRTSKIIVNPLINWTDDDVWRCIRDNHLPVNPLYECGYNRIGCVGCPMANYKGRMAQFARYPKYRDRYIRIADRLVEKRKERLGDKYKDWETGIKYFKWWLEDTILTGNFHLMRLATSRKTIHKGEK